jgi:hypothetical protein
MTGGLNDGFDKLFVLDALNQSTSKADDFSRLWVFGKNPSTLFASFTAYIFKHTRRLPKVLFELLYFWRLWIYNLDGV